MFLKKFRKYQLTSQQRKQTYTFLILLILIPRSVLIHFIIPYQIPFQTLFSFPISKTPSFTQLPPKNRQNQPPSLSKTTRSKSDASLPTPSPKWTRSKVIPLWRRFRLAKVAATWRGNRTKDFVIKNHLKRFF